MQKGGIRKTICIVGILLVFLICSVIFGSDTGALAFFLLLLISVSWLATQLIMKFIRWCIRVLEIKEEPETTNNSVETMCEAVKDLVSEIRSEPKTVEQSIIQEKETEESLVSQEASTEIEEAPKVIEKPVAVEIKSEKVSDTPVIPKVVKQEVIKVEEPLKSQPHKPESTRPKVQMSAEQMHTFAVACSAYTAKRDLAEIREELSRNRLEGEKPKPRVKTEEKKEREPAPRNMEEILLRMVINTSKTTFEKYCVICLRGASFSSVIRTTEAGVEYANIIAFKDSLKYIIICTQNVDNEAQMIQNAAEGKKQYSANKAVVLSQEYFSESAKKTALELGVELWGRDEFILMLLRVDAKYYS